MKCKFCNNRLMHIPAKKEIGRIKGYFWCKRCLRAFGPKIKRFTKDKLSDEQRNTRNIRIIAQRKTGISVKHLGMKWGLSVTAIYIITRSKNENL